MQRTIQRSSSRSRNSICSALSITQSTKISRNEIHHDDWARSARAAQDSFEDVLRVSDRIWGGTEQPYLSSLPRIAGRVAGNEPRSVAHDGAHRTHARLRHRADLQVRPEKLFLSGHAEELPDFTIRHAALRERQ